MLLDPDMGSGNRPALVAVDYDEPRPETFRGLKLFLPNGKELGLFATMREVEKAAIENGTAMIGLLSSCDNFVADGGVIPA